MFSRRGVPTLVRCSCCAASFSAKRGPLKCAHCGSLACSEDCFNVPAYNALAEVRGPVCRRCWPVVREGLVVGTGNMLSQTTYILINGQSFAKTVLDEDNSLTTFSYQNNDTVPVLISSQTTDDQGNTISSVNYQRIGTRDLAEDSRHDGPTGARQTPRSRPCRRSQVKAAPTSRACRC